MNRPLLAFAGLIAAGGTAVGVYVAVPGGGEEEVAEQVSTATPTASEPAAAPAPTPGPGVTLWRWGNVTVVVPEAEDTFVNRYVGSPSENPPDGGMLLSIRIGDSEVVIDADTGVVASENVSDADRSRTTDVLETVRIEESPSAEARGWPYVATQPTRPKIERGSLRYWEPDPSAGVYASYRCAVSSTPGHGCFIAFSNGRSTRGVFADSGETIADADSFAAEDLEAFERWTAAIERVAP